MAVRSKTGTAPLQHQPGKPKLTRQGNGADIKDDRRETYTRLNSVEQRVSKLEAQPRI
jgi:hypothetical protein